MSPQQAIAVDLGGTNLRVARIAPDGVICNQRRIETPADGRPAAVIAAIAELVAAVSGSRPPVPQPHSSKGRKGSIDVAEPLAGTPHGDAADYESAAEVVGVGVAAPGPLDPTSGVVYATPNLVGWDDFPLAERLSAVLRLPVLVNNDANLAALGEARFGAGRGFDPLIYLTVSTGVGGGIIQGGRIYQGAHGLAGELGHVIVRAGGPTCNFGHPGCLEALASGTGIARRAGERLAGGADSTIRDYVSNGQITALAVARAAAAGDALAGQIYREAGEALGYGIASFLNAYDVARVVIGGGVAQAWPLFEAPMWAAVRATTMAWPRRAVDIVPAELGDNAGLVGAATYALAAVSG